MTVPFMRAYALLLLKTCHKRNAPAIGGMSALIPIKNDPVANEKPWPASAPTKIVTRPTATMAAGLLTRAGGNRSLQHSMPCWATPEPDRQTA